MAPRPGALLATCVAVLALASACESERETSATEVPRRRADEVTTTDPAAPPRVLLAGDSILYDVTPALQAALPETSTEVEGLITPALSKATVRTTLLRALDERSTDVLVLMLGVWDRLPTPSGVSFESADWPAAYAREVIAPFATDVAERGTELLFLRPPPVRDAGPQEQLRRYGDAWQLYADEHPDDVRVVETGPWLGSSDEFLEVVPADDGTLVRARRTDGTHLCREGAVRIAEGLIELLEEPLGQGWAPEVAPRWDDGPWVERFVEGGQCPPP